MNLAMLPVCDNTTRSALFHEIAKRIEEAEIDELLTSGLDGEMIDRLRALPNGSALCLADLASGLFFVGIDLCRLRLLLDTLEERDRSAMLLEYYVEHGATLEMIRTLLRPKKAVLASYIEKICGARPRGRPMLPPASIRDRIHLAWAEIQQSHSGLAHRDHLVELHRQFPSYTLATLYSVLNEFKR